MKVLCIKTSCNLDDSEKIEYRSGKEYYAKLVGDDILVKDETGELCLAGVTAEEAVRMGIQETEHGYWDDWFNDHFKVIEEDK